MIESLLWTSTPLGIWMMKYINYISLLLYYGSVLRNEDKHMREILQWENEHDWLWYVIKILVKDNSEASSPQFQMVLFQDGFRCRWSNHLEISSLMYQLISLRYSSWLCVQSGRSGQVWHSINVKTIVMTIIAQALCSVSFPLQFHKIDNIILKFCSLITQLS